METSFCELREKEVINIGDGRSLGRVSDIVFNYPEGMVFGIVVPGRRGWHLFRFKCNDMFIDLCNVKKIGDDVILVDLRLTERPKKGKFERNCPPPPPPRPHPHKGGDRDGDEGYARPEPYGRIDLNDYD